MSSVVLVLLNMHTVKSCYLHYLYGLNYWDTNAIFICVVILVIFNKFFKWFFLLLLNFFIKFKFFTLYFLKKQLPDALLIGTITIHPLMFYFFMLIFLIKTLKINTKYTHNLLPINKNKLSLFLFITLALGGFWGLQSTIWGYFWVNDSVEWLLLLAILSLLYSMHKFDIKFLNFNAFILTFLLFNLVLMVRLNLFQTRHSFIEQRSLAILLLFGYILFYECILRITSLNKKPNTYLVGWSFAVILIIVGLSLISTSLLMSKVFFIFLGIFFLRYLHPGAIPSKVALHVFFFLFFFVWGIYFTFFYLTYTKITPFSKDVLFIFTDTFNFIGSFCFKKMEFKLLESVSFVVSSETMRTFSIFFGTTVSVLLNNWVLLYIAFTLLIFFV